MDAVNNIAEASSAQDMRSVIERIFRSDTPTIIAYKASGHFHKLHLL